MRGGGQPRTPGTQTPNLGDSVDHCTYLFVSDLTRTSRMSVSCVRTVLHTEHLTAPTPQSSFEEPGSVLESTARGPRRGSSKVYRCSAPGSSTGRTLLPHLLLPSVHITSHNEEMMRGTTSWSLLVLTWFPVTMEPQFLPEHPTIRVKGWFYCGGR